MKQDNTKQEDLTYLHKYVDDLKNNHGFELPDESAWIENVSGKMPVDSGIIIWVKTIMKWGEIFVCPWPNPAGGSTWEKIDGHHIVTHYQVAKKKAA